MAFYVRSQPIANAIDTVPNDALKARPKITIVNGDEVDPEVLKLAYKLIDFAKPVIKEAAIMSRQFGWAIIKFITDETDDYSTPANYRPGDSFLDFRAVAGGVCRDANVHSYVNDPNVRNYGMPLTYSLTPVEYVHSSRVALMRGLRDRRPIKTRGYHLGYSLVEPMAKAWLDYQNGLQSILKILEDKSLEVFYIENFKEILMKPASLTRTINAIKTCRKALGGYLLDSSARMELLDRSLTGIADTMEQFIIQLSAQANLPDTLLFGRSPAGQTSGEYEKGILNKLTSIWQAIELDPVYEQILGSFFKMMGYEGISFDLSYSSAVELSDKERADADRQEAAGFKDLADALGFLNSSGLMKPEVAAEIAQMAVGSSVHTVNLDDITGDKNLSFDVQPTTPPPTIAPAPPNPQDQAT